MSVTRIATRYAKSLIDFTQEQHKLERTLEDIQAFQETIKNRDLFLLFKSPIISPTKKRIIIDKVFKKGFDETTMAFFYIVLRKGREGLLPEIAEEFIAQYKEIKHISTVKLKMASQFSDETIEQIRKKLEASDATDENVEIITEVDESLIGGFVVELKDKLYDASVAHQLDKMKKGFTKNQYQKQS